MHVCLSTKFCILSFRLNSIGGFGDFTITTCIVDMLDFVLNILPMDHPYHPTDLRRVCAKDGSMYRTVEEYVGFADTLQDVVNSMTWQQPTSELKLLLSQYIGKCNAAWLRMPSSIEIVM